MSRRPAAPAAAPISEPTDDEAAQPTARAVVPAKPPAKRNKSAIQPYAPRRGNAIQGNEPPPQKVSYPEPPDPPAPERMKTAKVEACSLVIEHTLWTDGPRWRVRVLQGEREIEKGKWLPRAQFFGDLALKQRSFQKFLLQGLGRPVLG